MVNKRKVVFYLLMLIFIVGLPFMAGEVIVRLLSPEGIVTPETVYKESIEYIPSLFARAVIRRKEKVVRREAGAVWHINKYGYRGKAFILQKSKDTIRIIFLGGSHVFDAFASYDQDWPCLTGQYLQEAGFRNVEVINAGVPGYASWDVLGILYSEIHNFDPDYVVVCNAWNDIKYFRTLSDENTLLRAFGPLEGRNPFMYYNSWLDKLLCKSQLYVRLRHRYYAGTLLGVGKDLLSRIGLEGGKPKGTFTSEYGQNGIKQYELNLKTIVDVARNIGATPILLTQAKLVSESNNEKDKSNIRYNYQLLNHGALVRAFNECDEVVRKVAEEKGVYLIDLSKKYSGKSDLFFDHVHTTSKGSQFIAQEVAAKVREILKQNSLPW